MTTINTVTNTTSNTSTNSGTAKLTADMQTFLKLLTVQLQNQDPTNPMDPSKFTEQLVQFSQIEQQIQQTDKLDAMLVALNAGKAADALAYVGMEVQALGDTAYLEGGEADWSYGVPTGASNVTLNVYDSAGKLVYSESGETSAGRHDFTWDGMTKDGVQKTDGNSYRLEVVAKDASGEKLKTDTLVRGVVDAVETISGQTYLVVGKLGIDPDDVVFSRKPQADSAA